MTAASTQLDALAAALCRLWTVPAAGQPPRRWLPAEAAPVVVRDLTGRRFGDSTVDAAVAAAREFLAEPFPDPPDTVLGHSDPNVTNYLWDGARVRIVDFEDAGRRVVAAMWLHVLLTVDAARVRNPPGTARRQAEHLLALLRRSP